jgi:hypothetical protein
MHAARRLMAIPNDQGLSIRQTISVILGELTHINIPCIDACIIIIRYYKLG